ncbi:cell division protein FtsL [Roseateles koreensis]|uniref:Cell division protein FtsL n=1 Tax=Roseateles koreensis TaxID=2987526 RepID=A0ABT5KMJ7_9BURK|nr:cell division protein FtsL [Roseateles koreensis]MDC8784142.1 cell division protein FtsL [Roseateles koreensis]
MSRWVFVLLMAVLFSGMALIHSAYDARLLFTELDRAQAEGRRLEADAQRLQAERQAQATNLRVEQVARERLQMRAITPAVIQGADDKAASAPRTGKAP